MNSTIKLLDRFKEVCSLTSDNQAAIRLGISRATTSAWRKGRNHAEPESVETMAKACGLDAEEWVLRVQADREIVAARKQVWLRAAQRLAATAALVTLAFGLDVQTAHAGGLPAVNNNDAVIHYAPNASLLLGRIVAPPKHGNQALGRILTREHAVETLALRGGARATKEHRLLESSERLFGVRRIRCEGQRQFGAVEHGQVRAVAIRRGYVGGIADEGHAGHPLPPVFGGKCVE